MTAQKPRYVCEECRIVSPGVHWIEPDDPSIPPYSVPCPEKVRSEQEEKVAQIIADESSRAFKAAKETIQDAARRLPELSGNTIRAEFEMAQVPKPLIGAAFSWAQRQGLIQATGRTVPSTDEGTHSHRLFVWRSLVCKAVAS